ncbi:MAG: protein kinase [Myxococcota bacterium]
MSVSRRRFRILKEIAEGGFGKVYLAEQISSDGFSRIVAIKLLHAKWSTHDEVVKRTRDEARVLGRIRHQHIVKVEDLTSIESKCAIVMEYLEGVDLKWMAQFLKERKQQFPRAALFEIVLAVASALDAAYSGIPLQGDQPLKAIHRDIKPSNIFVTVAGGVKVLDFGTARANFAEREAKTMALAFGSQGYMAPERMLGEEDTPAADVFSLGITLYELLTLESFGRIPPRPNKFNKKMDERVASVPLDGDPEWVQQVRDTLRLMLSYAPADRPSAAQLVEIMDLLAQDANDTGLRRYCRTLVQEAKDALPAPDTSDPLIGTIVDEDDSGPVGREVANTVEFGATDGSQTGGERLDPPRQSTMNRSGGDPPPAPTTGGLSSVSLEPPETILHAGPLDAQPRPTPSGSPGRSLTPPPPAPENVRTVVPTAGGADGEPSVALGIDDPPRSEAATVLADPPPPQRSGALPTVVAVGVSTTVVVMVVVGFVLVLLVGVVAVVWFGGDGGKVDRPVVQQPSQPGVSIEAPDTRTDAARVPTVLEYAEAGGAKVEILGPGGFRATWDGLQPFDLGPAGEGEYKANVTPPGGQKLRLKRFVVEAGKKGCAYTFDRTAEEWLGGCD